MKRGCTAGLLIAALLAAFPASATLVTETIVGDMGATTGSTADVGAGTVTGHVTFDDATGTPGFVGDVFAPTDLVLNFSNGPTVTLLDDPTATIEVDPVSGDLLEVILFGVGLSGFGLTDTVDLAFDLGSPGFFFSDFLGNVLVEGSIRFADESPVPVPAPILLLAFGMLVSGLRGKGCGQG